MTGTGTFADIIRAVTDMWGLLALALLLIGLLAIQMTRGANPNVRVATFLVIFLGFLGSLYMAFGSAADEPAAQTVDADAATVTPSAADIDANAAAAAEYRQSVDDAYGNAAARMDNIAGQIAGEEPAPDPSATAPPRD
jgi:hypothetical protein